MGPFASQSEEGKAVNRALGLILRRPVLAAWSWLSKRRTVLQWAKLVGGLASAFVAAVGFYVVTPDGSQRLRKSFVWLTPDRTGRLVHEDAETPAFALKCGGRRAPLRTLRLIAGTNVFALTKPGRAAVLTLSARNGPRGEVVKTHAVEIDWSEEGFIDVYASLYNDRGVVVATLAGKNEYSVHQQFGPVLKNDSKLEVRRKGGEVLLWVHYINEETVELRGKFFNAQGAHIVTITESEVRFGPQHTISGHCSVGPAGIYFEPPN